MIDITIVIVLVWTHFFADFVLQTDAMATKKSVSNKILAQHCFLYGVPFVFFGLMFAVINAVVHFMVDWCTSRIAKKFWLANDRRNFFLTVGIDQAIHLTTLIITYKLLTS
jgi:hypothetical protein